MRTRSLLVLFLMSAVVASAAEKDAGTAAQPGPRPAGSFDTGALDRSIDPCVDFYQFACGGWRKANPIPPDQVRWGRFNVLAERNREILHQILEAARDPSRPRSPIEAKVGDFYAACMDEAGIEAQGSKPIAPILAAVDRGPVEGRSVPAAGRARGERAAGPVPVRLRSGPARLDAHDRHRRPGRHQPARPRRLPEDGREVRGEAREVPGARDAHARAVGEDCAEGEGGRRDGAAHRDGARERAAGPRRPAGSDESRQPDAHGRARAARAGLRFRELLPGDRRAAPSSV